MAACDFGLQISHILFFAFISLYSVGFIVHYCPSRFSKYNPCYSYFICSSRKARIHLQNRQKQITCLCWSMRLILIMRLIMRGMMELTMVTTAIMLLHCHTLPAPTLITYKWSCYFQHSWQQRSENLVGICITWVFFSLMFNYWLSVFSLFHLTRFESATNNVSGSYWLLKE